MGQDVAGATLNTQVFDIDADDPNTTTVTKTILAEHHEGTISLQVQGKDVAGTQPDGTQYGFLNALQITYDSAPRTGTMYFDFGRVSQQTRQAGWNNFHKGEKACSGCDSWSGKGGWIENAVDSAGNRTAVNVRIVDSDFRGTPDEGVTESPILEFPPTATRDGFRVKKPGCVRNKPCDIDAVSARLIV